MKGEGVDRWQFYSVKVRLTASKKEGQEKVRTEAQHGDV